MSPPVQTGGHSATGSGGPGGSPASGASGRSAASDTGAHIPVIRVSETRAPPASNRRNAPHPSRRGSFGPGDPGTCDDMADAATSSGYDEVFDDDGRLRAHYRPVFRSLGGLDLKSAADSIRHFLEARGVTFGSPPSRQMYRVDPVPRLIRRSEWRTIRTGVTQRMLALNRFLADIGPGMAGVGEGVVPARVITSSPFRRPYLESRRVVKAVAYGPDLVRDPAGRFLVLEDNLRYPSGLAFARASREARSRVLPMPEDRPTGHPDGVDVLASALTAVDRHAERDQIILLSDGPESAAWYEHREIAKGAELGIATIDDLGVDADGRLVITECGRVVRVLYNRSRFETLFSSAGVPNKLGRLLLRPLANGLLRCVNPFGCGLADDKLVHAYVPGMIKHYLGEEPILGSVKTFDPGDPVSRHHVMANMRSMVYKPRAGLGGSGIVFGPEATDADLDRVANIIRARPETLVAQQAIEISTHPTFSGSSLEPRRVDLRPFAFATGDETQVLEGGLTRFAASAGDVLVNSTAGGGSKDTVLTDFE
jgi:uncharacterized circularly permuted ATP-grasp superfamily protein